MKQFNILQTATLFFMSFFLVSSEAWTQETATFDYTGSNQTFNVPRGVSELTIHAWGAGGGGGRHRGAGGGGGAYETATWQVSAGDVVEMTIGKGGVGGKVGTEHGSEGGNTVVQVGAQSITATGGTGGMSYHQTAGKGGSGTYSGEDGIQSKYPTVTGGAGGRAGGNGDFMGGAGGASAYGRSFNDGFVPGGGGSGGGNNATNSGTGGAGRVVITYPKATATVTTATELAKGKPARQSSDKYKEGSASNAVDGNTRGSWSWKGNTITHTKPENDPWWEVDLGAVYDISKIEIWNRTDACCWNRLQNFHIMVSKTPIKGNNKKQNQFQTGEHSFTTGAQPSMILNGDRTGRYVRIFISGENKFLSLAEVKVFGSKPSVNIATAEPDKNYISKNPDPIDEGIWFVIQNKNNIDNDFAIPAKRMAMKVDGNGNLSMAAIPVNGNFDAFLWRTKKEGNNYRLINKKLGEDRSMDSGLDRPWMGKYGHYSGQYWMLKHSNEKDHGTNVYTMSNSYIKDQKALQLNGTSISVQNKDVNNTSQCWVFQPIELRKGYHIPTINTNGFDRSLSLPYGYKVVASNSVSDWALLNAHLIYKNMLGALLDNQTQKMKNNTTNRKTVVIISKDDSNEVEANQTPYIYGTFDSKWVADYRGGASGNGITLVTEEMMNKVGVYHRGNEDKSYREFEQVVHEFAHAIDFICGLNTSTFSAANGNAEWFPWKVQLLFNSAHSIGGNQDRSQLNKTERIYLNDIFRSSNTWIPARWLRNRAVDVN